AVSPVREAVTVIGRRLAPEDHRLRDFLTRMAQPYRWLDAASPEAVELLAERRVSDAGLPVVLEEDSVVPGATVERLVQAWRLDRPPSQTAYDLAIVGGGPAGLAAAVYAASDGLSTLVLEHDVPGGQASHTSLIENFFGFPDGIGGAELARLAGRQAERFGAEVLVLRGVTASSGDGLGPFALEVTGGCQVRAPVVIAAGGMVWRRLELDGIEALLGRGVYYGAGRSEAAQCGGDPVVVVGAGNSAGQAVMNLGNAGARVTMAVRGERLGKSMSAYLVRRILAHPLIDVRLTTEVAAVDSEDDHLAGVTLRDADGAAERLPARALFLCLGGQPRTAWAVDAGLALDAAGFILTGPDLVRDGRRPDTWPLDRDPLALETSVPGLFAAGDLRSGSTKRVAGAVGEGAMAVALAHRRLEELARAG
ncbi:MAG TPA: NAD(P)/FAD-dependent oxidoreductase, partial [Solirubrobacteraceae bacterium]|nr:NAD(P)/FAD-dependent oxidoreductase [Solirubrobacteraceae bacterium]